MTVLDISDMLRPHGLFIMGQDGARILIGTDARWWNVFTSSPEFSDQVKDPVDRWSKRILGDLAARLGAQAVFPSDGPPYAPFIAWALATGRFWQSPTGMMVHDTAGLMISIRGALELPAPLASTGIPTAKNPCDSCATRPCVSACPVDALSADMAYDVPACKAYLDAPGGADCMTQGCRVRCACPISQSFARSDAQSAFHMKAFRG
ncbi:ferredoxin [Tateyamaria sp.]|uniref:ferredoxin n=1 Tax=Tateyamaria sp. TaxID=1929288 RepID=UPI0032A01648